MLRFITIVYLFIPYFIFFLGWLKPVYALPLCLLLGYSLFKVYRNDAESEHQLFPFGAFHGVLLLLVTLLWVLLSGVGGIGFQNNDYEKHCSVLNDLITLPWPVSYAQGLPDQPGSAMLVYYIAFYLPAAIAGKLFGWQVANIVWFFWAYVGFALAHIWFAKFVGRKSLWVSIVFIFAGGLDFFGQIFAKGEIMRGTQHVEWWARPFHYSSNSSLLIWVPQHAIGGWLSTALVLYQILRERSCKFLGLSVIAGCFWSPFVCIGLLPFLAYGTLKNKFREVWNLHNLLLPPLIAIVSGLFFASLIYKLPGGFLSIEDLARYWPKIFLFLILEVGLYFYLCFNSKDLFKGDKDLLIVAAVTLLFMPLYRIGLNNDYLIRGSIPALLILWIFVARACFNTSHPQSLLVSRILIVLLFIGSFSALSGLTRSLTNYSFGPKPQTYYLSTPAFLPPQIAKQYLGDPESLFFRYLAR